MPLERPTSTRRPSSVMPPEPRAALLHLPMPPLVRVSLLLLLAGAPPSRPSCTIAQRHALDTRDRAGADVRRHLIAHVSSENPTATSRGTPNASCSANTQPACQVPRKPAPVATTRTPRRSRRSRATRTATGSARRARGTRAYAGARSSSRGGSTSHHDRDDPPVVEAAQAVEQLLGDPAERSPIFAGSGDSIQRIRRSPLSRLHTRKTSTTSPMTAITPSIVAPARMKSGTG